MNDSGVAIMGNGISTGENRAIEAVTGALASPLLKDNEIEGARYILLNITSGKNEVTMDEVAIVTDYIQEKAGLSADLIWGNCIDENLDDELSVTIIATGFQTAEERVIEKEKEKIALPLTPEPTTKQFVKPVVQNQFIKKEGSADTQQPFIKPIQDTIEKTPSFGGTSAPQGDLFTSPKPIHAAVVKKEEPEVIRHTLSLDEPEQEEAVEDAGFELKTSPSMFEFKLPSVFDAYKKETPSPSEGEEAEKPENIIREETVAQVEATPEKEIDFEDQLMKTKERILRLKELSMKLKSSNGLQELENEPAYKRRQKSLEDVPHSSQSQVSRFTLSFDDGETEIRPNNSFLHDNVD